MINPEVAISLPFSISPTGVVNSTTDQSKIWADRVLSVIGTSLSERVQRYYFGSKVFLESFAGSTQAQNIIPDLVAEAFGNYLPALTLSRVDANFDQNSSTITIVVYYTLPNDVQQNLQVGTIRIDGNSPYKESL